LHSVVVRACIPERNRGALRNREQYQDGPVAQPDRATGFLKGKDLKGEELCGYERGYVARWSQDFLIHPNGWRGVLPAPGTIIFISNWMIFAFRGAFRTFEKPGHDVHVLSRHDAPIHFLREIVDHKSRFLQQLAACRLRVAFTQIEPASGSGPEALPGKRTLAVLEFEQENVVLGIHDQQAG
jgi:hypothetical protein